MEDAIISNLFLHTVKTFGLCLQRGHTKNLRYVYKFLGDSTEIECFSQKLVYVLWILEPQLNYIISLTTLQNLTLWSVSVLVSVCGLHSRLHHSKTNSSCAYCDKFLLFLHLLYDSLPFQFFQMSQMNNSNILLGIRMIFVVFSITFMIRQNL